MLQVQSKCLTQDNSGVKIIQCIKSFQGTFVRSGDIFLVSIKQMKPKLTKKTKLKKGQTCFSLLIQTKYKIKSGIGYLQFQKNKAILLDKKKQPIGNRILGPVPFLLRKKGFLKIISLASNIL